MNAFKCSQMFNFQRTQRDEVLLFLFVSAIQLSEIEHQNRGTATVVMAGFFNSMRMP